MDVMVLTLWHIWKARNSLIFDHKSCTASEIIGRVMGDLGLWHCRYGKDKGAITIWRDYLYSFL
ncbi:hypothetical protein HU200_059309 [Digitaria exilis]|uniref:Uncharacterized protein n=1 Tax=Digitaria exilis TaxID=1010633 RepID=A0A835ACQ9_9POAL|nr:hypothetical protein HU200_059309 [Digitaria exilis]